MKNNFISDQRIKRRKEDLSKLELSIAKLEAKMSKYNINDMCLSKDEE